MKMKIELKGIERVKSKIKAIPSAMEAELRKEIFDFATEVKNEAVKAIEQPKSGHLYRKKVRGAWYSWRASAPGEAPAKRTGKNMARIMVQKANRSGKPASRVRFPKIFKMLERGMALGKDRQVLPRPLFGPILERMKPKFLDRVSAVVSKALNIVVRKK